MASIPVFAEGTVETLNDSYESEQGLCIGKEVEYGNDLYSIKEDGLYVSKNYGRDVLMDEGTITWVIENNGVLYWSKLDEYNTDIYRMNLSGDSNTILVRLFVPIEAFDVVGDDIYYLYNGEITLLNVLSNEETSMGLYDCQGFYIDDENIICPITIFYQQDTHTEKNVEEDESVKLLGTASYKSKLEQLTGPHIGYSSILDLKSKYQNKQKLSSFNYYGEQCVTYAYVRVREKVFGKNQTLISSGQSAKYIANTYYNAGFGENGSKHKSGAAVMTSKDGKKYRVTAYRASDDPNGSKITSNSFACFDSSSVYGHVVFVEEVVVENGTKYVYYTEGGEGFRSWEVKRKKFSDFYNGGKGYHGCVVFAPDHTHTYASNGKCTGKNCGDVYMGEDISASNLGDLGIYKQNGSGGVDAFTAPNKNSIYTPKSGKKVNTETVNVVAIVKNNNGTYNYQVTYGDYGKSEKRFVNRNDFKKKYTRNSDLPSTIEFHDMNAPTSLDKGKSFGLRGTITSNYSLTAIKGSIIRASDNKTVLSATDSGGSSYVIKSGKVNKNLKFNTLSPDTYYIKYEVCDSNNGRNEWISSNFKVGKVGTIPTLRAGDITGGKKIDISCSDQNAVIKYTVDGGKEHSISAGGSKTIEFKTAGNHTVVAWSVSGTTVSTKGTQSIKIEKSWLPTIIDWFKKKAGYLADIDIEYGNTSAQVIISGEGELYYTLNGSTPTTSSSKYTGPVEITSSCTVKAISVQQGYAPSDVATKDVVIKEPDAPSIQLSNTKQKIAQGKTATVSWDKVEYATKYVAYLYYDGECVDTYETTGTSASFRVSEVGEYTINVKAHNFVGYSSKSNSVSVMSMAPVTITIIDKIIREGEITDEIVDQVQQNINEHDGEDAITIEDNIISVQEIDYDSLPARSMTPSKKGFTFAGYGEGMYTPATEDITIYALYEINYYNVEFWNYWTSDSEHNSLLNSAQDIIYTFAATPPTVEDVPRGYAHIGWNVDSKVSNCFDFTYVDGDMKLYTSYAWENIDLPVVLEIVSAKRGNTCQSYDITLRYINNNLTDTQARIIMTLYTADGKVVYTATEDVDLMARDPGKYYTETIQATYSDKISKISAVMVQVKNDMTAGAVSEMVSTTDIEMPNADTYWDKWSDWSTTQPSNEPAYKNDVKGVSREIETKKQYRYRNKDYTSSSSSSLSGWTKYDTKRTSWSGTYGPVYYNPSNGSRNVWSESYVTSSNYKTVYRYYRYANSTCATYGSSYPDYNYYYEWEYDYPLDKVSGTSYSYKKWCSCGISKGYHTVYSVNWQGHGDYPASKWVSYNYGTRWYYQEPVYTYYYWKWLNWSSWSDTYHTGTEVQERTLYRYRDEFSCYDGYDPSRDSSLEEETIQTYDISGNIDGLENDYSGKLATVMVYKKTNTDPTQEQLQYVEQIALGDGNSYSFTVNPKEEIDYEKTGDYIVALAIEGCDKLVNVDIIKAPAPTYDVTFYADGEQYGDTQKVEYGNGVDVNTIGIPQKDGYRFIKWDKSVVNITKNISVNAIFEPETYPIVFVDHENQTTAISEMAYGEPVVAPKIEEVVGKTFIGWEGFDTDEETLVTGSCVYTALWENDLYTVTFCDFEGNVIGDVQEVEYGEPAELPESVVVDGVTYPWDTSNEEWWNVTHDMTIYPYKYTPKEIAAPASDVESGAYDEYLLVNLSADDDATIYYSEYEITDEDVIRFVEMQKNADTIVDDSVSLLSSEPDTIEDEPIPNDDASSSEVVENDYSSLTDIIVEYDESIPVTGSTVIYAFTVKDGKMSAISTFEYDVNDFVAVEEETTVDDNAEQITIPTVNVKPGEEVSVPITIKNNPGLNNLSVVLSYDVDKFTLVSTKNGDVFLDKEFDEELKDDGSCKFTWISSTDNTCDGVLVTMTFKAADSIEEGEYNITFADSVASDSTEEEKYLVLVDGTIVNSITMLGDVNGDGEVDFADGIRILKHDVGLIDLTGDALVTGDVNGDGEVDFADAILVLKFDVGLISSFKK